MKIHVTRVTTEGVDVDIPESCPECRTNFSAPNALLSCEWMATEHSAHLGMARPESDDSYQDFPEVRIVTGFKCRQCQTVVAGEEG